MQQHRTYWGLGICAFAIPVAAVAASPISGRFQSLDQLDAIIMAQSGAPIGQAGGAAAPLDRRLRLAQCQHAPNFRRINDRTAALSCDMPHWRIRIPMVVTADDPVEGTAHVKQSADTSNELAANAVVVRKGAKVDIIVEDPKLAITTSGTALEDGAVGAIITVKAEPFNKNVKARVSNFETVVLLEGQPDEF